MKTALIVLVVVLLGVAALLLVLTVRWLGLLLESHRRQARHCGRTGAVSIGKASAANVPCEHRRGNGDRPNAEQSPPTSTAGE